MVRIRNPITRDQHHGEVKGPSGPPEKDEPTRFRRKEHLVVKGTLVGIRVPTLNETVHNDRAEGRTARPTQGIKAVRTTFFARSAGRTSRPGGG